MAATTKIFRVPVDAWIDQDDEDANHGMSEFLNLKGDTGEVRKALMHFPAILDEDVTITDAKLYFYLDEGWSGGPHEVTVSRIISRWAEDKVTYPGPSINSVPANQATVTITGGAVGDEVVVDITNIENDANDGNLYFGFQLVVDTDGNKKIAAAQNRKPGRRPWVEITYVDNPKAPTGLRPGGDLAVATKTPILAWSSRATQEAFRVLIYSDEAGTALVHDSGTVVDDRRHYKLGETAFELPVTGLRYWKVRIRNVWGIWSDYSDLVGVRYKSPGVLTLVSPGGNVLEETTPPIDWTFTGRTQAAFDIWILEGAEGGYGENWGEVYGGEGYRESGGWHMGRTKSSDTRAQIPPGVIKRHDESMYLLTLRVWDTEDRVAAPGTPIYVEYAVVLTFNADPTVDPVDSITATSGGYYVELTWEDDVQPDFYGIVRDGVYLFDRIDPQEVFVSGQTYSKRIYNVQPMEENMYWVVRIVKDGNRVAKHSTPNPTDTITFIPQGIWLVDEDTNEGVNLRGGDDADIQLEIGESSTVFYGINRRAPIVHRDSIRGYEGSISGLIMSRQQKERLEQFKSELPSKQFRLVTGDLSIVVALGKITALNPTDNPVDSGATKLWKASIEVLQQDDWTFRYRY